MRNADHSSRGQERIQVEVAKHRRRITRKWSGIRQDLHQSVHLELQIELGGDYLVKVGGGSPEARKALKRAVARVIKRVQRERNYNSLDQMREESGFEVTSRLPEREIADTVDLALVLESLSKIDRIILQGRFMNLPFEEISKQTGMSVGAVHKRFRTLITQITAQLRRDTS